MHNSDKSAYSEDVVKKAQEAEKKAIADAVAEQVKRGITPITSGEFERSSFVSGFFENLEGIEIKFVQREEFRTNHPIMKPYIARGIPGRDQPIVSLVCSWKRVIPQERKSMLKRHRPSGISEKLEGSG